MTMSGAWSFIVGVLWAVSAAGIAWCCLHAARRMTYVTLADGQRMERPLPLLIRLLLPLTPNVTWLFDRPLFESSRKKIERTLISAGLEEVLSPADFLALRLLSPMVIGLLFILMLLFVLPGLPGQKVIAHRQWIFFVLALVLTAAYPSSWLRKELSERHRRMHRALPFVLDLLTLSVEAGLDFMSALQRIVERRVIDPIGEELIRVLREIQLGKTRRESLRDMAYRVNQPDIRSVLNALVQADEMGVSIGAILRIQADQMRVRRFQRAETLAHQAPVKMLFPLVVFIFPAVFLVLLGPVILQMTRQWV